MSLHILSDKELINKFLRKDGTISHERFRSKKYKSEFNNLLNLINSNNLLTGMKIAEQLYCLKYDITSIMQCYNCKLKAVKFVSFTSGYRKYCSSKCSANSKNVKEKQKKTKLERYGSENYNNLDKHKKTCLEKYGTKYYTNTKKMEQTNLVRYGVSWVSQMEKSKEKAKQTCLEKYGTKHFSQSHISLDVYSKLNNKEWLIQQHHYDKKSRGLLANELSIDKTTLNCFLNKHNISFKNFPISVPEKQLVEYIESKYNTKVITNNRTIIKPLELDIYLPEYKLAIEYNGIYWHRPEIYGSKDKWIRYHQNKIDLCKEKGIQLLHLWENYLDHNALLNDAINSIIDNNLEEVYNDIFYKEQ